MRANSLCPTGFVAAYYFKIATNFAADKPDRVNASRKIMRNPVVPLIAFLLVGCASLPPYTNTKTRDAATLVDTDGSSGGGKLVWIDTIDGAMAPKPPLYLTPGRHHLSLNLDNSQMFEGGLNDGQANEQQMEMDVSFEANGYYRLNGFVAENGLFYVVQLVDEASGSICSQVRSRRIPLGYKPPPDFPTR
jgi:hypothetical protein